MQHIPKALYYSLKRISTLKSCRPVKESKVKAHLRGTNNFSQMDVHPSITVDQMSIIGFSILKFHQLKNKAKSIRLEQSQITSRKPITSHNISYKSYNTTNLFKHFKSIQCQEKSQLYVIQKVKTN